MKKLKIYLDTSVISYLFAEDTPEKMEDTHLFWEDLINDKYDIFLSPVVLDEIQKCSETKRSDMFDKMKEIHYQILEKTDEVNLLAQKYLDSGALTEKSRNDCLHIAHAVIHNCDIIVSWNFKHIVNLKVINKIKAVNTINMYKEISIVSPVMMPKEL